MRLTASECVDLFNVIAHGDEKHKVWLLEAIICWARGQPKPSEEIVTKRGPGNW